MPFCIIRALSIVSQEFYPMEERPVVFYYLWVLLADLPVSFGNRFFLCHVIPFGGPFLLYFFYLCFIWPFFLCPIWPLFVDSIFILAVVIKADELVFSSKLSPCLDLEPYIIAIIVFAQIDIFKVM